MLNSNTAPKQKLDNLEVISLWKFTLGCQKYGAAEGGL